MTTKTFSKTAKIRFLKNELRLSRHHIADHGELVGKLYFIEAENHRLQAWLVESSQDKSRWEATARGVVGLVLSEMMNHGHWDKATSCVWCRQAEKILVSLGFKLTVGNAAPAGVPWR